MGNPIGKFMDTDNLIFGIGQVSKITGVSSRSLRYWESQGYISTLKSDNEKQTSRQYNVQNLLKIFRIKYFQDEGYTLQGAVEQALKLQEQLPIVKHFMENQIQDIIIEEDRGIIDFGFVDDSKKQKILGIVDRNANSHFEIQDV